MRSALLEGRRSQVNVLGFMPQQKAMQHVAETDYLLLTMTNDISLPGKLFEYLALGKPILPSAARRGSFPHSEEDRIGLVRRF